MALISASYPGLNKNVIGYWPSLRADVVPSCWLPMWLRVVLVRNNISPFHHPLCSLLCRSIGVPSGLLDEILAPLWRRDERDVTATSNLPRLDFRCWRFGIFSRTRSGRELELSMRETTPPFARCRTSPLSTGQHCLHLRSTNFHAFEFSSGDMLQKRVAIDF